MQALVETLNSWNYELGQVLEASGTGPFLAIAVVFAAGVVTSFTPCVYPVIPITVSYLGGAAAGNRRRAIWLSLTYVGGLAVVYASLGVVAARLGKTFGQYTRSPWVFGPIAVLLIVFGLVMLDVIPIRVPGFVTNLQTKGARRGGYLGALAMGIASAFITAPCAAPVLGTVLLAVATSGNPVWGSFLLLVFALGLSVLLLALGISSGMLTSLPKPGPWMVWIKRVFGVGMILIGGYYALQTYSMIAGRGGGV